MNMQIFPKELSYIKWNGIIQKFKCEFEAFSQSDYSNCWSMVCKIQLCKNNQKVINAPINPFEYKPSGRCEWSSDILMCQQQDGGRGYKTQIIFPLIFMKIYGQSCGLKWFELSNLLRNEMMKWFFSSINRLGLIVLTMVN